MLRKHLRIHLRIPPRVSMFSLFYSRERSPGTLAVRSPRITFARRKGGEEKK